MVQIYLEDIKVEDMVWPTRNPHLNSLENVSITIRGRLLEGRTILFTKSIVICLICIIRIMFNGTH